MNDFIEMSRWAGQREDLTQAGGGNSAFKRSENEMLIKASGYSLADIDEENGYSIVDYKKIRNFFLNYQNLDELREEESQRIIHSAFIAGEKPSIETFLHAVSGKYSLHIHSIVVNALTCRVNGDKEIKSLFPDALIVPYATPGVELAKAYFKVYKSNMDTSEYEPEVVFLMNHGILVSGESFEQVKRTMEDVLKKIEYYLGLNCFKSYRINEKLQTLYGNGIIWKVTDFNILQAWKELGNTWEIAFCPDSVVFLGKKILLISNPEDMKKEFSLHCECYGEPKIIMCEDELFIHASSVKKALEIQSVLSFNAQVCMINEDTKCRLLTDVEMNEVLGLESEKYRQTMK